MSDVVEPNTGEDPRIEADTLAAEIAEHGRSIGFPYVSAQADFADASPMTDALGDPYANSLFDWIPSLGRYWEDRRVGLANPLMRAVRTTANPFYYDGACLRDWRHRTIASHIDLTVLAQTGMSAAIVTPARLPLGTVGAVFWATNRPFDDLREVFDREAAGLAFRSLKLCSAYAELVGERNRFDATLSAREVQCVRWATYGKTDQEIAIILTISTPTVRFHLKNAARKLTAHGRSQTVCRALALGYVSAPHCTIDSGQRRSGETTRQFRH